VNHMRLSFVVASGLLLGVIAGAIGGYSVRPSAPSQSVTEAVAPHGHGSIAAYHADGSLFLRREIENSLTQAGQNAIAWCASGLSTSPVGFGCSNWTSSISMGTSTGVMNAAATNSVVPAGCTPNPGNQGTSGVWCNGWKAEVTFEITEATDVSVVYGVSSYAFDNLFVSPSIHLGPGDRLIVTITFSIPA